jgi:hypothetical protein
MNLAGVDVSAGPSGCWPWTRGRDKDGYGKLAYGSMHNRKHVRAHRVVWELFYGEIIPGHWVLHRCDNPPCVNPMHLWLGTPSQNTRDCLSKNRRRSARGESNGQAKLTAEQVLKIRERYAAGERRQHIADELGVSWGLVNLIVTRRRWKHIP